MKLLSRAVAPAALLSILAVSAFFAALLNFSVNMPVGDDFEVFLEFLLRWENSETIGERVVLLTQKHNEHRPVVARLITLGVYLLSGTINFTILKCIGATFLLLTPLFLTLGTAKTVSAPLLFHAYCLLLLSFYSVEATLWATASLAIYPGIGFSVAAIAAASKRRTLLCVFCCLCAAGSAANGLFSFFAAALPAAKTGRKRLIALLLVCGISLAALAVVTPSDNSHLTFSAVSLVPAYTVLLLGSSLGFGTAYGSVMGSCFFFSAFAFALNKNLRHVFPLAICLFSLLSAGAIALARANQGLETAYQSSRYTPISLLFACGCLGLVWSSLSLRNRTLLYSLCALHFFASIFSNFWQFERYEQLASDALLRWNLAAEALPYRSTSDSRFLLQMAKASGIFHSVATEAERRWKAVPTTCLAPERKKDLVTIVEHLTWGPDYLVVDGAVFEWEAKRCEEVIVVALHPKGKSFFKAARRVRHDVARFHEANFGRRVTEESGFFAAIPRQSLVPAPHAIGIRCRKNGKDFIGLPPPTPIPPNRSE